MLKNIEETTTPLGIVVVEGFDPSTDWLRAEDLLAFIASAPLGGVLWCGSEPAFGAEDAATYESLRASGTIIRDSRSLAVIMTEAMAGGDASPVEAWGEPELITLAANRKLVVDPRLRLVTQASASIVDDSWTGFLPPLGPDQEHIAFHNFHGLVGGSRIGFEGVRRGFSIERDFENLLWERVSKALSHHHAEQGAIILHGQSGVGKSIALARLALKARETGNAVLLSHGRVPQAGDVSEFLQAVDELAGITLVIVDSTVLPARYDDLLRSFRSLGHRVVVVGSCYRIEDKSQVGEKRLVEVPALLSDGEQKRLMQLVARYVPDVAPHLKEASKSEHALARFYRYLPESRERISEGLGREALLTERELRVRGARRRVRQPETALGLALLEAGFGGDESPLFEDHVTDNVSGPAGRVIDYVMSASRLFKAIPVGLVLRAVSRDLMLSSGATDTNLLLDLFEGQDLFRWKYGDDEGSDLLIGARLQIEAEIVCNRRLGGPRGEAAALIDLIGCAHRAGPEDNEETRFVVDIVQALGPDGPAGDRYKDQFADVARALTELRAQNGVMNGRLMLQESALRRAFVRKHVEINPDQKAALLLEATAAVDGALAAIEDGAGRIYASRRTKEHLLVERAATYGFLATDSAQHAGDPSQIWSSYKAARDATRLATSRVDSYMPLDISLWLSSRILKETSNLNTEQELELKADLLSTLDSVDAGALDPTQFEMFQRQRLSAAEVLKDTAIADEAFQALDATGSTVGYYLRARGLAPRRDKSDGVFSDADIERASAAAAYLIQHYSRISTDPRCMQLLLDMEWIKSTRRWLFKGLRQPLPHLREDRLRAKSYLLDLGLTQPEGLQTRYRYLEAILTWLDGSEETAIKIWRKLDTDTRYVEAGRVLARHVVTDERQQPVVYSGVAERQIAGDRWSIYVEAVGRRVDLLANSFPNEDLAVGRTVRNFAIAFNYRGPIADRVATRLASR
ncbi:hypothetical protein LA66_00445 [Aureimonas altamirensis]|uniref:Uncharacterized protein n=1 Tax=Aureimonas altamirensis TaxID=370622 RepID=A0A0B1Q8R5_9HYPH|nr:hypothetical protein [Aureimonas altamirensis]KHJ55195.1 hypothetical protein LA66_00445 [Aureimonas altamirensis]